MIFLDFEKAMELFHAKQFSYRIRIKKKKLFFPSVCPASTCKLPIIVQEKEKGVLFHYLGYLVCQQKKLLWWESTINFSCNI